MDRLEGRIFRGEIAGNWEPLMKLPAGAEHFRAEWTVPAGGWFKVQVRALKNGEPTGVVSVEHVGVGEVFVVAGQSNSANHGEEKQVSRTRKVSASDQGSWRLADDPQPGASGDGGSFIPPFGDALAEKLSVPIGIVAAGVGATSVREWLPSGFRFSNPPTLTRYVTALDGGVWESAGKLFEPFVARLRIMGPQGFRALIWHQGESDGNQADASRTLSGTHYAHYLEHLIRETRREAGWDFPWFVAQASYHTPAQPGSPDIRAAQRSVCKPGVALEGPDSDALTGAMRDHNGQGVHFSGPGLRAHASAWVDKVAPWLELQLAAATPAKKQVPTRLAIPREQFDVDGRPAFIMHPSESVRRKLQPWIMYAPTLPGYPDEAERWMHQKFLAAGIAVAGVDVGEAYGSPAGNRVLDRFYEHLTQKRGFALKPCLFGRSRGGLWVSSWAIQDPTRVAGIIGIYPVYDFRSYPGLTNAASAYGLSPVELDRRAAEFNPIARTGILARARVPFALIHGDDDKVVPLGSNSAAILEAYRSQGVGDLVRLIILPGQGHSFHEPYFHSQELVDFAIAKARQGAADP